MSKMIFSVTIDEHENGTIQVNAQEHEVEGVSKEDRIAKTINCLAQGIGVFVAREGKPGKTAEMIFEKADNMMRNAARQVWEAKED